MAGKKKKMCNIQLAGKDEKGRPILEFSGDDETCGKVIATLASQKEVVIRKASEKE